MKRSVVIALIPVIVLALAGPGHAEAASPHSLTYRVHHSLFGDIGTYANTIERDGATTVVETRLHLLVRTLGIVLHREDAVRTERWDGDRLVAFRGVTTANDETVVISGEAVSAGFAVTSPTGTVLAPASITPSNPWSARFLTGAVMLRVDTGAIENVTVSPPKEMVVVIAAETVRTREYDIAADPPYRVWLDAGDVPIQFSVADESGLVTFTLADRS